MGKLIVESYMHLLDTQVASWRKVGKERNQEKQDSNMKDTDLNS